MTSHAHLPQVIEQVELVQAGDDFGHYCRVHADDPGCEADPATCVAYCGYRFDPDCDEVFDDIEDLCLVCASMLEAEWWS